MLRSHIMAHSIDIFNMGLQWLCCKHLPGVLLPHNWHSTLQGLCCCQALHQTQLRCFTTGHRGSSQGTQAMPQFCHEIPSFLTLLRHLHCTVKPNAHLLTVMADEAYPAYKLVRGQCLHMIAFAVVKHAAYVGLKVWQSSSSGCCLHTLHLHTVALSSSSGCSTIPLFETAMYAWQFLPQLQVKQARYKEQRGAAHYLMTKTFKADRHDLQLLL